MVVLRPGVSGPASPQVDDAYCGFVVKQEVASLSLSLVAFAHPFWVRDVRCPRSLYTLGPLVRALVPADKGFDSGQNMRSCRLLRRSSRVDQCVRN